MSNDLADNHTLSNDVVKILINDLGLSNRQNQIEKLKSLRK